MARLSDEQLAAVKNQYGVTELWSWSKLDKFLISPYEYYLKYIKHVKEDRFDCAYAPLGGLCHTIIEDFYHGKISYENMATMFESGWALNIGISGLKFDRNDSQKNESIADRYKMNLDCFFKDHQKIDKKIVLEQFTAAKIGDHVFQGYIDAIFRDEDGCYNIIDWKTSTKYSGKTIEEKSGQLVVYAISLMQQGIPLEKIKAGWNFLKYVCVEYPQKNGSTKSRIVERSKLGEALQTNAKMWLKANGYNEQEVETYLHSLMDNNSISVLPEEVGSLYRLSDCFVYIPLSKELVAHWENLIVTTIEEIKMRESMHIQSGSDAAFWDTPENVAAQSYYFATLCGYSANLHLPYKAYLNKLDEAKHASLYSGVGEELEPCENVSVTTSNDLSWLNDL